MGALKDTTQRGATETKTHAREHAKVAYDFSNPVLRYTRHQPPDWLLFTVQPTGGLARDRKGSMVAAR